MDETPTKHVTKPTWTKLASVGVSSGGWPRGVGASSPVVARGRASLPPMGKTKLALRDPDEACDSTRHSSCSQEYNEEAPDAPLCFFLIAVSVIIGIGLGAATIGHIIYDLAPNFVPPSPPSPPHPTWPPPPSTGQQLPTTTTLRNGVVMPRLLLGTGAATWMDDQKTEAMVRSGLLAGFMGIDTANHYRVHGGVKRGIAAA